MQVTDRVHLYKEAKIWRDEIYLYISVVPGLGFFTRTKAVCLSNFSEVLGTTMQNYIANMYAELLELSHGHISSYINNSPLRSSRSSKFIVLCQR